MLIWRGENRVAYYALLERSLKLKSRKLGVTKIVRTLSVMSLYRLSGTHDAHVKKALLGVLNAGDRTSELDIGINQVTKADAH